MEENLSLVKKYWWVLAIGGGGLLLYMLLHRGSSSSSSQQLVPTQNTTGVTPTSADLGTVLSQILSGQQQNASNISALGNMQNQFSTQLANAQTQLAGQLASMTTATPVNPQPVITVYQTPPAPASAPVAAPTLPTLPTPIPPATSTPTPTFNGVPLPLSTAEKTAQQNFITQESLNPNPQYLNSILASEQAIYGQNFSSLVPGYAGMS